MLNMKKVKDNRKKVVVSGYYGFDNFGDEAILGVLVSGLKSMGANVRVLSSNHKKTAKLYNVDATFYICMFQVVYRIFSADVLVSGGGSLLQDVTSAKSLIYYLIIINIALLFNKKVIIFAQGLGPINNKFCAFLTKKTLKRCTLLSVRDRKSNLLLKKWGIDADLVCDPLFGLEIKKTETQNKIGVQLRSFKTLTDKLLVKLAEHVNKEFSDKEIEIYSFQDSLDLEVCKKFEKILKEINPGIKTNLIFNLTSQDILDKISKLEYMVAMRFHAILIAIKYGVKSLAVSYDIKVEKLAEEAEIPCVSMQANEDYDTAFATLKALDSGKLLEFSNTKTFDWSKIENLITN